MSATTRTLILGRGRDCDILLTHTSISRRHAELTLPPVGDPSIRDLQSTGGTFLVRGGKETPVTQTALKFTDTLRLGDYEISVKNLLSLVPEESSRIENKKAPVPAAGPAGPQKTRMMRCACGSIKERGKPCPDCGS